MNWKCYQERLEYSWTEIFIRNVWIFMNWKLNYSWTENECCRERLNIHERKCYQEHLNIHELKCYKDWCNNHELKMLSGKIVTA